jgi:DNA-binding transcriptional LysR family regulator
VQTLSARRVSVGRAVPHRSAHVPEKLQTFMAKEVPNLAETRARTAAGRLPRLSVPRAVVPILLEPLIASFCRAYPEVEVEIAASEELIDLAAEGFDAGIRLGQFIAADMVAVRRMKPFRFIIVGSPAYLARSGRPERPDGLRRRFV